MAYSQERIDEIFTRICEQIKTGRSLRSVLKDNDMPASETFFKWVDSNESKTKQYARACEERADAMFEEMLDISDDGTNDFQKVDLGDGVEVEKFNHEHVQRSKLRVDTRKWMLSKMMPKKYGDKIDITSEGEKISSPVINVLPLNDNTEPEAE